jgi:hypothetical protein
MNVGQGGDDPGAWLQRDGLASSACSRDEEYKSCVLPRVLEERVSCVFFLRLDVGLCPLQLLETSCVPGCAVLSYVLGRRKEPGSTSQGLIGSNVPGHKWPVGLWGTTRVRCLPGWLTRSS